MKKFLLILILISYSIASFGVSVNYFYCCGKLKTVSFSEIKPAKNCKSKIKKGCCAGKKCCKNVTVTVKLKTDQKSSDKINFNFETQELPVVVFSDNYTYPELSLLTSANQYIHPPGNLPKRSILFCMFRI